MRANKQPSLIAEILSAMGSALATAAAVQVGAKPRGHNLRTLGIDPSEFGKIGRG